MNKGVDIKKKKKNVTWCDFLQNVANYLEKKLSNGDKEKIADGCRLNHVQ